jgi:non-ribosomal peptide synthetase component F
LVPLLDAQARRTPDCTAVLYNDRAITFAELHTRANRVAHRLRALGVGPDMLVGVAVGRDLDLIVAVLAVVKAGGAYVPLDPAYPFDRLAGIFASMAKYFATIPAALAAAGSRARELGLAGGEPVSGVSGPTTPGH